MDLGLAGKSVIVTGGASNIGRSIALAFGRENCRVAIADIDEPQASKVVEQIKSQGSNSQFIKTDVTDWNQVQSMVAKVIADFGRIDVLINNVGWSPFGFFMDSEIGKWEKTVKINLWSAIYCTKAALVQMIRQKSGDIIFIGSPSSQGMKNQAIYAACKAGVESFSYALAREVGRWGIRVNVVNPVGAVEPSSPEEMGTGSMHFTGGEGAESWKGVPQEMRADLKKKAHPLREIVTPDDIAAMVVLMASAPARKYTGQTMGKITGLEM